MLFSMDFYRDGDIQVVSLILIFVQPLEMGQRVEDVGEIEQNNIIAQKYLKKEPFVKPELCPASDVSLVPMNDRPIFDEIGIRNRWCSR